ncbi:ComEC/Rec2 family competence protein [Coraliomargarita parva]|uniref:ComEC/Rec2 family competence protein n=1 Tax=Coraliomargarita parva TaxID=3014050 RepID=UPI0022B3203C|nr:ComEC/Rec2 family competence protein [Coraliomargarita parva]
MESNQSPVRAPLLYLLPGAVTGLELARCWPQAAGLLMLAAAVGLALLAWRFASHPGFIWHLLFGAAVLMAFWSYAAVRGPRIPTDKELSYPERELELLLQIDRILTPAGDGTGLRATTSVLETPAIGLIRKSDRIYLELPPALADKQFQRSAVLAVKGVVSSLPRNDESRDFDHYLQSMGIYYRLQRTNQARLKEPPKAFFRFCHRINQDLQAILRLESPEETGLQRIYMAMLLGLKSELDPSQKQRYRMSGTMHFFAISGLHIGVIALVIGNGLMLCRIPGLIRPFLGLPLLFLYVEVTGAAPSAMRAFLMTAFFWTSFALRRQRSPFAALIGSALAVLVYDPLQLHSLGFQLSYAVVASILLFGLPLQAAVQAQLQPYRWLPEINWKRHHRAIQWCLHQLSLLFCISLSAWLASAPLTASHYGMLSPGSLLLNMLLVHLAALVIITGVLSMGIGLAGIPLVSAYLNYAAWLVLAAMDGLVAHSTSFEFMSFNCPNFPPLLAYGTLASYLAMLLWIHQDRKRVQGLYLAIPAVTVPLAISLGLILNA